MKILISILFLFTSVSAPAQNNRGAITAKDLKQLAGNWAGNLVYTDYKDNKTQVTLAARIEIIDMNDSLQLNFVYTEPNGKEVREKTTLRIYDNGNKLSFDGGEYDITETARRGPRLTIVGEKEGVDNYRSAEYRHTITFSPMSLTIIKEIRYADMTEYFIRNRSVFTKK